MKQQSEPGRLIEGYGKEITETLSKVIAIKSISPKSGGEGELKRAQFLESFLKEMGVKPQRYDYKDDMGAIRSSVVVKYGSCDQTIWIIGHIDTVSEGDRSLWKTDPFKATVMNGRIYGRGAADNGQGTMICLYVLKALKESGASLKYNVGLVLAADEEIGSVYGLQKLLKENIFKDGDMFIVPDWGTPKGDMIEVGEKSLLWLKFTVTGEQAHASTPNMGVNAFRYASLYICMADELLHRKYNKASKIFDPQVSTFEMTKHEKNVDSTNIMPGKDVFYIDCRVLPEYDVNEITKDLRELAKRPEFKKVKIDVEEFMKQEAAPPTREDSAIAKMLENSLLSVRGIKAKKIGIGGGTCAAFVRRAGYDSVVYGTQDDVAHQPNEYVVLNNIINDAKTVAQLFV